jgi:hypothetical protein
MTFTGSWQLLVIEVELALPNIKQYFHDSNRHHVENTVNWAVKTAG